MTDHAAIRSAFERNARIVTTRPAVAQKTYVTRVHIRDGFTCDIEEGPWTLPLTSAPQPAATPPAQRQAPSRGQHSAVAWP
jgi:hypothetical protein